MSLYRICYASALSPDLAAEGLETLLGKAVENNRKLKISGCIAYTPRLILQMIEGPLLTVYPLMETIRRDERHHSIRMLASYSTADRLHSDCPMQHTDFASFRALLLSMPLLPGELSRMLQPERLKLAA